MPRSHVVIVQPDLLRLIASGRKHVEARLMRCRRPPFGCVRAGEVLYFKPPGGAVSLRGVVTRVRQWSGLRPDDVRRLGLRHGRSVAAGRGFWDARLGARHAVLIWFADVRPVERGPRVARQYGSGWVVLERGLPGGRYDPSKKLWFSKTVKRYRRPG